MRFEVTTDSRPYAGDRRLLATISPNGDGYRDRALIRFRLARKASVNVIVAAAGFRARTVFDRRIELEPGLHVVPWRPRARIPPRTYVVRFVVRESDQRVSRYGFERPVATPVVRVLGIEAAFRHESYAPESAAELVLESDEPVLSLQLFRSGVERVLTRTNDAMNGEPVTDTFELRRADRRDRPRRVRIWIGDWPSGLYFAKLTGAHAQPGFAPFIVRARRRGEHRVAVVLPTYTWQAYNFRDGDGDGYGDTWYAGGRRRALLGRAYLDRGVPPFFRSYDLNFLHWLARSERKGQDRGADFLSDSDLGQFGSARSLARAYDLIIFPGHHEYVTRREFDLVSGFRDRGGNLMFLSANNFFWRVDRRRHVLTRVAKWRAVGRPEAALVGVQYLANDHGRRKAPYVVRNTSRARWLFEGTGLRRGSRFGRFGIEIDARTSRSPPGTLVLATIPNLLGRGRTAEMTYYETRKGARVFAAGAFTLAGYAKFMPVSRLLDNLWVRLSRP